MPVTPEQIRTRVAMAKADNVSKEKFGRISRDSDVWRAAYRVALAIERGERKVSTRPRVSREHLTQRIVIPL